METMDIGICLLGWECEDEADYFELCCECGQAFDLREPIEVLYHDEFGHRPLPRH